MTPRKDGDFFNWLEAQLKISISNHNTYYYKPQEFKSLTELAEILTSGKNYSCGIFKNGHRNNENFIQTYTIGLDIDNGENEVQMTLDEAKKTFADYKHIIMPSKSHQKEKHGKVADRFRVILFLSEKIDNTKDYYATWAKLKELYPAIDQQCKDPARFWYPSSSYVSKSDTGKTIDVVKYVTPEKVEITEVKSKGKLSRNTMDFLTFGAPGGLWNATMSKACVDIREQGYNKEETISLLEKPTGHLDEEDLRVVDSIFKKELRYEARDNGRCFDFKTVAELYDSKETLEWDVDRYLMKGGLSIIGGDPKAGKSTIIRQLTKNILNGGEFLGRKCKQGNVMYLALEEHQAMFTQQLKQVGVDRDSKMYTHVGPFKNFENRYDDLIYSISEMDIKFVVIDTMGLFCDISDLNDYNSVNKELIRLRQVARDTDAHIVVIHHINKGYQGKKGTLLGSQAITGAVDTIMKLHRRGKDRFMDINGRGVHGLYDHPLKFSWDTQTYTLGEKDVDDF